MQKGEIIYVLDTVELGEDVATERVLAGRDTATGKAIIYTGEDGAFLGVFQGTGVAGDRVPIIRQGLGVGVLAGGTFTAGAEVMPKADGTGEVVLLDNSAADKFAVGHAGTAGVNGQLAEIDIGFTFAFRPMPAGGGE